MTVIKLKIKRFLIEMKKKKNKKKIKKSWENKIGKC